MKRIIILCDGTWKKVDSQYPTNVVRLAQALLPVDAVGVPQIPIYVPGVGTGKGVTGFSRAADKWLGGALGWGLLDNIAEAYRHLIFLYEPGDEIFVFGFSRGAYTARSLTGLIRSTGIIPRDQLYNLPIAINRYRTVGDDRTHPNSEESHRHRKEMSPHIVTSDLELAWRKANLDTTSANDLYRLTVAYLGVWDSVGALGVPRHLSVAGWFNRKKYQFHDADLSSMVKSARHAVALDERRPSYEPTRWTNLPAMQDSVPDGETLFQERFMLGDHGSVGGGGDILDLSSIGLTWIIEGAQHVDLGFDQRVLQTIKHQHNPQGPLRNMSKKPGLADKVFRLSQRDRKGPDSIAELHPSVLLRIAAEYAGAGSPRYRPGSLKRLDQTKLEVAASDEAARVFSRQTLNA